MELANALATTLEVLRLKLKSYPLIWVTDLTIWSLTESIVISPTLERVTSWALVLSETPFSFMSPAPTLFTPFSSVFSSEKNEVKYKYGGIGMLVDGGLSMFMNDGLMFFQSFLTSFKKMIKISEIKKE